MINVSNDYKTALTQPRQTDAKIIYGNSTITSNDINSIKRSFNAELFKTIAKMINIDSNISIEKGTTLNVQNGLLIGDEYEYASLGLYKVIETPTLNKDTNSYQILAYDKIVDSMVLYGLTSSDITYPCTTRQLLVAIFSKLGWSTSGIPQSFVNSTSMIESDVYSNMNMTYRDVLDELCTITCMFLIDVNGSPTLKQKTITSEVIDEEYCKDVNVEIKDHVFFNSLVFSRVNNTDNIYRKDDESIAQNGLKEYNVKDLQILSLNWRGNFIDEMWNYIKEFEYYAFDIETFGITYLEPIDEFTLSIFNNTYDTILLNSDLTICGGITEQIYSNKPEDSETNYKYADEQDKRNGQATIVLDKRLKKLESEITEIPIITTEQSGTSSIELNDLATANIIEFRVHPTIEDILGLIVGNIIIDDSLLIDNREIVFRDANNNEKAFDLPMLYFYDDDVYDEFIYDAVEERAYMIQRVQVDSQGNKSILQTPVEIEYEFTPLGLDESDYIIYVATCSSAYIYAKGMTVNEYTKSFASSYEVDSKITQTANQINAQVSEKVDKSEVISSINIAVQEQQGIVELKGNSVTIESDNFELDRYGNAIFRGGSIYLNNGSKIMGDDGLMSTYIIFSPGHFTPVGYDVLGEDSSHNIYVKKSKITFDFEIPNDFVVTDAYIVLIHTPVHLLDFFNPQQYTTGYSRNLKLYKSLENIPPYVEIDAMEGYMFIPDTNIEEISNAFGPEGFTGSTSGGTRQSSFELKDYINNGVNQFVIQTSNANPTTTQDANLQTGACYGMMYITGYMNYTE